MGCKNTLIWVLSKNTGWEGAKTPQIGCMNILRWVTKITEVGCRKQSNGIGCQKDGVKESVIWGVENTHTDEV